MPTENTQFAGVIAPYQPLYLGGKFANYEASGQDFYQGFQGRIMTGDTFSLVADILPAQTAPVVLIPNGVIPSSMRWRILGWKISVRGNVGWSNTSPSGIPYLSVQGTDGSPAIHAPFTALEPFATYVPTPGAVLPLLLGEAGGYCVATFTYSASAKTITASAAIFVASKLIGTPVQIVDGTGRSSTAIVTANTTTVLTLSQAFNVAPADHASTAKDSVIGVFYQNVKTYTDTTHIVLPNAAGTPYTASLLDSFFVGAVAGAGVGQVRRIIANDNAGSLTLDSALSVAVDTTTTAITLSRNPSTKGVIDMNFEMGAVLSLATGIQVAVANLSGTSPLGSSVRVLLDIMAAV